MKIKHKETNIIIDITYPVFGKHWENIYGYLLHSGGQILFFYGNNDTIQYECLTNRYEINVYGAVGSNTGIVFGDGDTGFYQVNKV